MMPHSLATAVELFTTGMAVVGMGYFITAIVAARLLLQERLAALAAYAPGVSILKSLKGVDPGMLDAFRSHEGGERHAGRAAAAFALAQQQGLR